MEKKKWTTTKKRREYEQQIFRDQQGTPWQRFSRAFGILEPSYKVKYSGNDLNKELMKQQKKDVLFACLPLPFYSFPMWPYSAEHAKSAWSYTYYYCAICNNIVANKTDQEIYCVCLQFIVSLESLVWLPRLLCYNCSKEEAKLGLSYYPLILSSRQQLLDLLSPVLKHFDDRLDKTKCIVCCKEIKKKTNVSICDDEDCIKGNQLFKINSVIAPKERLMNLLEFLEEEKVDINKTLRWKVCHALKCTNTSKDALQCKNCHRVSYCSAKCKEISQTIHKEECCINYLKVWDIKKLKII